MKKGALASLYRRHSYSQHPLWGLSRRRSDPFGRRYRPALCAVIERHEAEDAWKEPTREYLEERRKTVRLPIQTGEIMDVAEQN